MCATDFASVLSMSLEGATIHFEDLLQSLDDDGAFQRRMAVQLLHLEMWRLCVKCHLL
jgi:hypothetical protein